MKRVASPVGAAAAASPAAPGIHQPGPDQGIRFSDQELQTRAWAFSDGP